MNITKSIETLFQKYLPSPFAIAILLTLLTIFLALVATPAPENQNHLIAILGYWENGIWNSSLLVFAIQMMLILVLGHILVLSKPMTLIMNGITKGIHNSSQAVIFVSVSTLLVSFFNWGLGLIFGAILARKVAEVANKNNFTINYPLVGAAGYSGLMIWHGGFSGSAPLKIAEEGHLQSLMDGAPAEIQAQVPNLIAFNATVLSTSNLVLFGILLVFIPLLLRFVDKKTTSSQNIQNRITTPKALKPSKTDSNKIDSSKFLGISVGGLILVTFFIRYYTNLLEGVITPNMLNFLMLGMALCMHQTFSSFLAALQEAIKGVGGILIQFPLYFGIMGIMKDSGMVIQIADFFVAIATPITLPIFTFFSAGLVNIFVPSGGGQWAIQGPIVIESALKLGVPLPKAIMALSYGDQVTNMLQPFWALPLLGITKLKAKEILPYSLLVMLLGVVVFILGLLLL